MTHPKEHEGGGQEKRILVMLALVRLYFEVGYSCLHSMVVSSRTLKHMMVLGAINNFREKAIWPNMAPHIILLNIKELVQELASYRASATKIL